MLVKGIVKRGKGEGAPLGFPTANIDLLEPIESGVYKGDVRVDDTEYQTALYVGDNSDILEVHIIDFSADLYGKEIEVNVGEKIRDVEVYKDKETMQNLIKKDILNIKK